MSSKVQTPVGLFLSTFIVVFAIVFFIIVFVASLPGLINTVHNGGSSKGAIIYYLSMALGVLGGLYKRYSTEQRIATLHKACESDSAETILKNCRANKTPYAVYLRSFSVEKYSKPLLTQILSGKVEPPPAREVEAELLAQMGGIMPVLALSDPSDPFPTPGFHRFRRLGEYWVDFLRKLLKDSSLIIIYHADDSPGLLTEIDLIHDMELFDKTLVILRGNTISGSGLSFHPRFRSVVYESCRPFPETLAQALRGHLENIFGQTLHPQRESAPALSGTPWSQSETEQQSFTQPYSQADAEKRLLSRGLAIIFASFLAIVLSVKLFSPASRQRSSSILDEKGVVGFNQENGFSTSLEISRRRNAASSMERYFSDQGYKVQVTLTGLESEAIEFQFFNSASGEQIDKLINLEVLKWLADSGFTRAFAWNDTLLTRTYDLRDFIY